MTETIATLACGIFFGAALYISLVQHPATLEAGIPFAARFFPPMYRRAAILQMACAFTGGLAGVLAWWQGSGFLWLVGAALLVSVVPVTLIRIKPINDQLLAPGRDPAAADTEELLRRWAPLHGVRTAQSGIAFLIFLARLGAS